MKKSILFIFGALFLLQACAQKSKTEQQPELSEISYTEKDAEIFADILSKYKNESDKPIATLIPELGKYFLGQEYVAHTLEVNDQERLIVNLRELDCTTYAENLLALARTLKSENQTFEQFATEIKKIRYRDGNLNEYPSRLHYFSDWIYNNKDNALVTTPADSFGMPYSNQVNFMSTHPNSYKHLKSNPGYVSVIEQQEKEINSKSYFYLPKENIAEYEYLLKEGDIIGLTTSIDGLDVAHVGILVEQNGKLHLLHASQSNLKVEISDEPISSFLKPSSKNTGIMIARPVEI
ncbi:MAG: N-acetylmuramoyl-L-alanine amidase-like domain-containing protein [Balneola sp.]